MRASAASAVLTGIVLVGPWVLLEWHAPQSVNGDLDPITTLSTSPGVVIGLGLASACGVAATIALFIAACHRKGREQPGRGFEVDIRGL